jgi:hypothetical protein
MMTVLPGQKQSFRNSPIDQKQMDSAIESITKLIKGSSPLVDEVVVHNNTKRCHVDIAFTTGKVYINITNPEDENFRFE